MSSCLDRFFEVVLWKFSVESFCLSNFLTDGQRLFCLINFSFLTFELSNFQIIAKQLMNVVYFNQLTGPMHAVRWLK